MENWKKRLRELSFMKGYYFKLEDNGLVEKKDDQLVFEREKLEHFIEQEIEKAREEAKRECANEQLAEIEISRNEERKRTLEEVIKLFDARRTQGLSEMFIIDQIKKKYVSLTNKDKE